MLTLSFILLLLLSEVVHIEGSRHNHHHHHKNHVKPEISKKGSVSQATDGSSFKNLHTSLNVAPSLNSTRRSIWDALNNANISVENHVHSYTTKSKIDNGENSTRRSIWDMINNSNISVENHVHSYTSKSTINKDANSTRRSVWDILKNANISIQNSVHSVTVRSDLLEPKKDDKKRFDGYEQTGIRKSFVHNPPIVEQDIKSFNKSKKDLLPMKGLDEMGDKRDEEPGEVAVQGKSPFDVAAAIEDNDQMVIPMLEKQHYKQMKKVSEEKVHSTEQPEYVISDQGHFPAEDDPFYFDGKHHGHGKHSNEAEMYDRGDDRENYMKHMGRGMINDDREMDDRDNERDPSRYNHEEEEERNDRDEDDRRGGGGFEHFEKEDRPPKMDDEEYVHHNLRENGPHMSQAAFENGYHPEHYEDDRGEHENKYNDNEDEPMESHGSDERGGDWEQNERPNMPDHRNFHSRSHLHRMRGRYQPEADRYHANDNDEDVSASPIRRLLRNRGPPHMEDFPSRSSHIFDRKRGPDDYNDNIGRREHFTHHGRPIEARNDRRAVEKPRSPCDKKKSGICDELHGELLRHLGIHLKR